MISKITGKKQQMKKEERVRKKESMCSQWPVTLANAYGAHKPPGPKEWLLQGKGIKGWNLLNLSYSRGPKNQDP